MNSKDGTEDNSAELQIVSFKLGKGTFAVNVSQVREIGRVQDITTIPKMPDYIEGVMNLRGQITTVIDLKKRLNIDQDGTSAHTDESRIIVAEIDDTQLGIIVDSVEDVIRVPIKSISLPPKSIGSGEKSDFLSGICKMSDKLIMLLDLDMIVSDRELDRIAKFENESIVKGALV